MSEFKATCACKKNELLFSAPIKTVVQCHCQMCRKMQGSDYSTWIVIPDAQVTIKSSHGDLSNYGPNTRSSKSFCSSCGTVLYCVNGKHFKGHKIVPLGVVDHYSPTLKPQIQVYTEDKAEWVQIHDDVRVFPSK